MLKKDSNFQRLKVGGRGWSGSASYWLGPDHLLVVEVVNYTERYRRFYFRDVQAVFVQANRLRLIYHLILGLPLLICLIALSVGLVQVSMRGPFPGEWIAFVGWGIPCVLFLAAMLVNHLRGTTCACHVRTAVQTQKLKGINRWRNAEKLLERLQPLILAAQAAAAVQETSPPASLPEQSPGASAAGPANP